MGREALIKMANPESCVTRSRHTTLEPVTTANARPGPAILDHASPFDRAPPFHSKSRLLRTSARG